MLAYVFWHVPRAGVAAREYEAAHRGFHAALWRVPIAGLTAVRVFRLATIPWLGSRGPGYEDWHLLSDSAALDVLNTAAVNNHRRLPHDEIAALAGDGTAGLYGMRLGTPIEPMHSYWLSKPEGMSYRDFHAAMQPAIDAGCCLWGRRMTLGPTPEFCLHAPAPISSPLPVAHGMPLETVLRHSVE